ncbi:LuxR C-terminal-related transcriptional regulator [Aquibacillus rhizosphaerae]|uniref:LuxR C-terminal-related transcriptional regulator n=1 Tax=Aquibacillus rhizosphaerae TaxID=3051431 RepID=A0ABT7L0Z3_9BACI|nr:LuxR C-terminal-related transcriptional regulator [Aquibacillus sp. LR5S19]MDL4839517.1 LuxR C-terminal-related transcriptional regulator [Aquibacillus sp. LR5S19]
MKTNTDNSNIETILKEVENVSFVGRDRELSLFKQWLLDATAKRKILNLHGTGGTGKTYLLNAFERIATQENYIFLQVDCRDFIQTPLTLAENLLTQLYSKYNYTQNNNTYTLQECFHVFNELAQPIVIAIDSYEQMQGLERWFRNAFLRQLPVNARIIICGRHPLKGEWQESPAWRTIVKKMKLTDFNYSITKQYLKHYEIVNEAFIQRIWVITKGHPLALSLAVLTNENTNLDQEIFDTNSGSTPILLQLTRLWLLEAYDEELQTLTEAAAVLRHFEQSSLEFVLQKKIPINLFNQLISLSFVTRRKNGWYVHDLIRDTIKVDLKSRNHDKYIMLRERSAAFYHSKVNRTHAEFDIAEFFYHLGDEFIQSTFFQDTIDDSLYLEQVGEHNINEIKNYFIRRKELLAEDNADFFNRETNNTYKHYVSLHHNRMESKLLDENYITKMGYEGARLLKNKNDDTLGLSVIVPINKRTITQLENEPVSSCYFRQLDSEEYQAYAEVETNSGWFIRMLDCLDPKDTSSRSYLLYNLFPLLLSGGRIITSTPLSFFQELLKNFGFVEVPGAVHYDFGQDHPSPTYLLDVRGNRLSAYLDNFSKTLNSQDRINMIMRTYSFTEREKEVVRLILDECSNSQIAEQLFVAEITVKKHVGRILKKVDVKNRTQLIKRLIELI